MQTTSNFLMIRPVNFGFNAETAVNNAFQVAGAGGHIHAAALAEFDDFVSLLRKNGIDVTVIEDEPEPHTPDSIFPNNWISFHRNGMICLYPMYAHNRRQERRPGVIKTLEEKFRIRKTLDLSSYEAKNLFLEGTGSMVLDRARHIAYACLSPRTDKIVMLEFCDRMGYKPVLFLASDANGRPIYHTNVMMCVADRYIVACLDSIPAKVEREDIRATMEKSGKEIVTITMEQMNQFAGNMLQVNNNKQEKLLVMSTRAYESLTPDQLDILGKFNRIIHSPLNTIETNGGGSARCMMAEVHLPLLADA